MSYASNATSAARAIAKKGVKAVVLRQKGAGFDPVTGYVVAPGENDQENVQAVRLPPDLGTARYSNGVKVDTLDKRERCKLLISGVFREPNPGDVIFIGADKWEVEGCNTLSPGGVNILYTVGAVRA